MVSKIKDSRAFHILQLLFWLDDFCNLECNEKKLKLMVRGTFIFSCLSFLGGFLS